MSWLLSPATALVALFRKGFSKESLSLRAFTWPKPGQRNIWACGDFAMVANDPNVVFSVVTSVLLTPRIDVSDERKIES